MTAIFEFLTKMIKLKIACISSTVRDTANRVYMQDTLLNSQKNFRLSKNGGYFEFLTKMVKLKIACIS